MIAAILSAWAVSLTLPFPYSSCFAQPDRAEMPGVLHWPCMLKRKMENIDVEWIYRGSGVPNEDNEKKKHIEMSVLCSFLPPRIFSMYGCSSSTRRLLAWTLSRGGELMSTIEQATVQCMSHVSWTMLAPSWAYSPSSNSRHCVM